VQQQRQRLVNIMSSYIYILAIIALVFSLAACDRRDTTNNLIEGQTYLLKTSTGRILSLQASGDNIQFSIIDKTHIYPSFIYVKDKGLTNVTTTTFTQSGGEVTIRDDGADGIPEIRMSKTNTMMPYNLDRMDITYLPLKRVDPTGPDQNDAKLR
jgi:hypothetical protein